MRFLLMFVALMPMGCQPTQPVDEYPIPVRAAELVQSYRDDPHAGKAYDGRRVLLGLSNPVHVGDSLHWHLGSPPNRAAVIVCLFDGPVPEPGERVWITGTCRGRVHDGKVRERTGYDFHVLVTDCRPARPPRQER